MWPVSWFPAPRDGQQELEEAWDLISHLRRLRIFPLSPGYSSLPNLGCDPTATGHLGLTWVLWEEELGHGAVVLGCEGRQDHWSQESPGPEGPVPLLLAAACASISCSHLGRLLDKGNFCQCSCQDAPGDVCKESSIHWSPPARPQPCGRGCSRHVSCPSSSECPTPLACTLSPGRQPPQFWSFHCHL